jgi:hypothetical protein
MSLRPVSTSTEVVFSTSRASERPASITPGRAQLHVLRKHEADPAFTENPKLRSHTFASTIRLLATFGEIDLAVEVLQESEEKGVWVSADVQEHLNGEKAQLYTYLVSTMVEKGFHVKAGELHSKARGEGVWRDFPDLATKVRGVLMDAGLIKEHEI